MSILPSDLLKLTRSSETQPVWFIGHGSPMNALFDNPFTKSLGQLGASIETPKAILVISAHWLTPGNSFVQASEMPETIHDFGGFPKELHQYQYQVSGSPEMASLLAHESKIIKPTTEWGLDHGAWTVLCHLFPERNVPCFELSIDYNKPLSYHVELAKELQFLREKGVLIIGSGNIVHNLKASIPNLSVGKETFSYDWAEEFDVWSTQQLFDKNIDKLLDYPKAPGGTYAVPTPDHYIPMLYAIALARENEQVHTTFEQIVYGGISMRTFDIH